MTEREHLLRVVKWYNVTSKFGFPFPLYIISDFGFLFKYQITQENLVDRREIVNLMPPELVLLREKYREFVISIMGREIISRIRSYKLSDIIVGVLIVKIFGEIYKKCIKGDLIKERFQLLDETFSNIPVYEAILEEAKLSRTYSFIFEKRFMEVVLNDKYYIINSIERFDLDTLKLIALLQTDLVTSQFGDLLDIYNLFVFPQAHDVVNFSLEIIPSVLETKRVSGQQTFSIDGYNGITRKGNLDSLLLSELAYEEELFYQKYLEGELIYYAYERHKEEIRDLHYIIIDASASMRGIREIFGRGLSLALAKRLTLKGDEVILRFFDSELYEVMPAFKDNIPVIKVLSFRSEKGRNYKKVFSQLLNELAILKSEKKKRVILYIITHAQCHIPVEIVKKLSSIVYTYGIFILPSMGGVHLNYLSFLNQYQIIDNQTLMDGRLRAKKALDIVKEAANI